LPHLEETHLVFKEKKTLQGQTFLPTLLLKNKRKNQLIMSHGGWNNNRYQMGQANNNHNLRRNAAFAEPVYEDVSEPDFDEAPAIATGPRFGRPSKSDLQTEFDYDQRFQQQNPFNRAQSNTSYQQQNANPTSQSNFSGRHMTTGRFMEDQLNEPHSNMNHEWDDDFENFSSHMNDNTNRKEGPAYSDTNYSSYSTNRPSHSLAGTHSSHTLSSHPQPPGGAIATVSPVTSRPSSLIRELPPKKEATPILPPSSPVEPPKPQSRVNHRYQQYTKCPRQPNRVVAKKAKNARLKPGDEDMQILKCPNCQSFLKVLKMAVFMECHTCSSVNPATSSISSTSASVSGVHSFR
jgi:hypothetical protein